VWWYTNVIPSRWEVEVGGWRSKAILGKNVRPYLKTTNQRKRAGGMVQVVSTKALNLNPTTINNNNNNNDF
jgi:hypothetical protein